MNPTLKAIIVFEVVIGLLLILWGYSVGPPAVAHFGFGVLVGMGVPTVVIWALNERKGKS